MSILYSGFSLAHAGIDEHRKSDIQLEITTHMGDEQVFVKGDIVYYLISLSKDSYLLLLYQDAKNNIYQMLPNNFSPKTYFHADEYFPFPNKEAPFQFEVSAPYGKEKIWLFATNIPFPKLKATDLTNGFKLVDTKNMDSVLSVIRDFSLANGTNLAEAHVEIMTRQK